MTLALLQVLCHDEDGVILVQGLNDSAHMGTTVNLSNRAQGYDSMRPHSPVCQQLIRERVLHRPTSQGAPLVAQHRCL